MRIYFRAKCRNETVFSPSLLWRQVSGLAGMEYISSGLMKTCSTA